MKKSVLFLSVILIAILSACSSSDDNGPIGEAGAYILNEGSLNGSIALYEENGDKVTTDVYLQANNGVPLGELPQSMNIKNGKAYVVVTTSSGNGYVDVVDMATFKSVAIIDKFSYPREFVAVSNDKGYLSNGNGLEISNDVIVVDLRNNSVIKTIKVGAGPEKMVQIGNFLYVANSGGWGNNDKTISVIDIQKDEVVSTIDVEYCPVDMVVDRDNNIWAFCSGKPDASYARHDLKLVKVDQSNNNETTVFPIGTKAGFGIKSLAVSKGGDFIYYTNNGVYRMPVDATALPTEKFITEADYKDVTFYGLDVDPKSGDIYGLKSGDTFGAAGKMVIFDNAGKLKSTHQVGVNPNSAIFNY